MREFCLCPGTNKSVGIFFVACKQPYSENSCKLMFKINKDTDIEKQNHHRQA